MRRINSDFANGLGNLLSRTLTLIELRLNGIVPRRVDQPPTETSSEKHLAGPDGLLAYVLTLKQLEFNRALEAHLATRASCRINTLTNLRLGRWPKTRRKRAAQPETVLYCSGLKHSALLSASRVSVYAEQRRSAISGLNLAFESNFLRTPLRAEVSNW